MAPPPLRLRCRSRPQADIVLPRSEASERIGKPSPRRSNARFAMLPERGFDSPPAVASMRSSDACARSVANFASVQYVQSIEADGDPGGVI